MCSYRPTYDFQIFAVERIKKRSILLQSNGINLFALGDQETLDVIADTKTQLQAVRRRIQKIWQAEDGGFFL